MTTKQFVITIWEVPGHRLLRTHQYGCETREQAIDFAQKLTRNHWQATGVTYKVVQIATEADKKIALDEWADLLKRQRETRALLTEMHERHREKFYRENKEVLDSLTPEERYEHTVISRKG